MNGRVLPLQGSEHTAVDALLPFYVNGTLQGEELDRVRQHVAACDACRREADWLRDVFAACAAISPLPNPALTTHADRMTARTVDGPPQRSHSPIVTGWRSTQPWVRTLVAAQLAALAVLTALLAADVTDQPSYRTLGADAHSAPNRDAIAVMFDPTITEAEMRRVLASARARIVDGPTATHAFVLEVPTAQLGEAIQKLRAERAVLFAEPLGARASR